MNFPNYTFLRHKKNHTIAIFYSNIDDLQDNFSPEELEEYDNTPVSYESLDIDTLKELLSNILENYNFHSRCQYEPDLLVECTKYAGCTDAMCAAFLRHYIIEIDKRYR